MVEGIFSCVGGSWKFDGIFCERHPNRSGTNTTSFVQEHIIIIVETIDIMNAAAAGCHRINQQYSSSSTHFELHTLSSLSTVFDIAR